MGAMDKTENVRPKGLGVRHLQTLFLFLAVLLAYSMRVNMSIAIVAMTANITGNITETKSDYTTFDWSHSVQAVILSSFFWGYVILQIPAGALARRFGGKVLITFSVFINSVISFFLPVAAFFGGWQLVCAGRFLQGLTQAFVYPCTHHLISQWVPLEEKGFLSTMIYAGGHLGIAMQLMLGGLVASAWGWPAIFYTNGTLGTIWTVAYLILGSASPEQSKIISKTELRYIQRSLGRVGKQKHYPVPWKEIMTCVPFWAVIVAHCGHNWCFFTLMTEMPSYMSKVLGFNLKRSGVISSLPYLAMYLLSFPMGLMTDLIIAKNWLSIANTRKLFNSMGSFGPALGLIGLSYTSANNIVLAVIILIVSVGISAGGFAGFIKFIHSLQNYKSCNYLQLVHIDLAPNFSGILMGITNFLANIISIIAPLVCGFIVTDEKDPAEWRKVFFIASGVYFFCNLFFIIFSTSERQPWNEPEQTEVEMEALNEK